MVFRIVLQLKKDMSRVYGSCGPHRVVAYLSTMDWETWLPVSLPGGERVAIFDLGASLRWHGV
jgi:hypothetical protein